MRKLTFVLLFISIFTSVWAQKSIQFIPLDSIKGNIHTFSVDNFDYIYTTNRDVVVKYQNRTDTMFATSLKSFIPYSIESSKSFRLLLFDKERSAVFFLDNTLTPIDGSIELADLDLFQAVLVCESFNGNAFWVLDQGNMRLLKFNQKLEAEVKIENLNFLFNERPSPIQMLEKNDVLYIHFPQKGVAVFDVFGTYLKFMPLKADYIQLIDGKLYVIHQKQLQILNLPLLELELTVSLPKQARQFVLKNNLLYLKTRQGLFIYQLSFSP